jgi:hypothetical protein
LTAVPDRTSRPRVDLVFRPSRADARAERAVLFTPCIRPERRATDRFQPPVSAVKMREIDTSDPVGRGAERTEHSTAHLRSREPP